MCVNQYFIRIFAPAYDSEVSYLQEKHGKMVPNLNSPNLQWED